MFLLVIYPITAVAIEAVLPITVPARLVHDFSCLAIVVIVWSSCSRDADAPLVISFLTPSSPDLVCAALAIIACIAAALAAMLSDDAVVASEYALTSAVSVCHPATSGALCEKSGNSIERYSFNDEITWYHACRCMFSEAVTALTLALSCAPLLPPPPLDFAIAAPFAVSRCCR